MWTERPVVDEIGLRFTLSFDDVRAVAPDALRHRVTVNFEAETQGITADRIVDDVLAHVLEMPR